MLQKHVDHVPIEPFQKILRKHAERIGQDGIALRIGLSERRVTQIINHGQWIQFDTADKIVTLLEGPMAWWEDDELNRIYYEMDFTKLDILNPVGPGAPEDFAREAIMGAYEREPTISKAAKSLHIDPTSYARRLKKYLGLDPETDMRVAA